MLTRAHACLCSYRQKHIHGGKAFLQRQEIIPAVVHLNLSAELTCVETEHSFGFAPPKHQLSPPIIVVMSALLIQQGPEGPRLRWCTGSQCSPVCLERVWFL